MANVKPTDLVQDNKLTRMGVLLKSSYSHDYCKLRITCGTVVDGIGAQMCWDEFAALGLMQPKTWYHGRIRTAVQTAKGRAYWRIVARKYPHLA